MSRKQILRFLKEFSTVFTPIFKLFYNSFSIIENLPARVTEFAPVLSAVLDGVLAGGFSAALDIVFAEGLTTVRLGVESAKAIWRIFVL